MVTFQLYFIFHLRYFIFSRTYVQLSPLSTQKQHGATEFFVETMAVVVLVFGAFVEKLRTEKSQNKGLTRFNVSIKFSIYLRKRLD